MANIIADAALGLLSIIFNFFNMNNISISGLYEAYDLFFEILEFVCYFLPMGTVSAIFSIVLMILTTRIIISVLTMLWNILPVL